MNLIARIFIATDLKKLDWKAATLLGILSLIYLGCWRYLLGDTYWPANYNLMIGKELGGILSTEIAPDIPITSRYGYDSQFFWAMSVDPVPGRAMIDSSLDAVVYRRQRVLLPVLAYLTTDDPNKKIFALWFWNGIAWLLGLKGILSICSYLRAAPLIPVLFYLFNPGLFISFIRPMADTLGIGIFVLAVSSWLNKKYIAASLFFGFSVLAKETNLILILFWGILSLLFRFRSERAGLLYLSLCLVPFIAWQYVLFRLYGIWPAEDYDHPMLFFGQATLQMMMSWFNGAVSGGQVVLATLCTISAIFFLCFYYYLWRNPLGWLLLGTSVLLLSLPLNVMEYFYGFARVFAPFFILLVPFLFSKLENPGSSIRLKPI
jgi:hypothetical protein